MNRWILGVVLLGLLAGRSSGGPPAFRRLDPGLAILASAVGTENVRIASPADLAARLDRVGAEKGSDRQEWRARAEKAIAEAGLDLREETLVILQRVYGTGMAKARLDLRQDGRVVKAEVSVAWPKGPATPDTAFYFFAFGVRKADVDRVEIPDGGSAEATGTGTVFDVGRAPVRIPTSPPPR